MSVIIQPTQLRTMLYGISVSRSTPDTLPATAAQNIFTIAGGRVVVTSLVGQVTTAIQNQACTVKLTSTPTTGTALDITSATAITNKEAGSLITLPLTLGGALNVQVAGAGEVPGALGFLLPIGTLSYTTSATNTGAIKWDITYVPYDTGASVALA